MIAPVVPVGMATPPLTPVPIGMTSTPVPEGIAVPLIPVGVGREPVPHILNCWCGTFHVWPPTAGNGPSASFTGLNLEGYLEGGL